MAEQILRNQTDHTDAVAEVLPDRYFCGTKLPSQLVSTPDNMRRSKFSHLHRDCPDTIEHFGEFEWEAVGPGPDIGILPQTVGDDSNRNPPSRWLRRLRLGHQTYRSFTE